ncbi:hypothetical protein [Zoogloea sp.]|uniref:hypothetical protein n=1 Tax=Zoogloea sp. TaxID=49181 RepID=UPI001D95F46D|nr:hypothetical protein [Zoogloea sp.]MBK6655417.1 hypothetical protein [Zoogloea sp.]
MTKNTKTKRVLTTDAKTGQSWWSEPMTFRRNRSKLEAEMANQPSAEKTEHAPAPQSDVAADVPFEAPTDETASIVASEQATAAAAPVSPSPDTEGVPAKKKADIENLEQLIAEAYARKGKPLGVSTKIQRLLSQNHSLDEEAMNRLMLLVTDDLQLAVPRQILIASCEVSGLPPVRAALRDFVQALMGQSPLFAKDGLRAAINNLPEAPSMAEALRIVAAYEPAKADDKGPLKPKELQTLRRNATNLLVTWFALHRSLNPEELSRLLFESVWEPAAKELVDDTARLRVLTEIEHPAGVGLACQRFHRQAAEARLGQEQARSEASALCQELEALKAQLQQAQAERSTLKAELEALQADSARALSDLKAQRGADRMHLQHDIEQLRGRMVRRLNDSVEMLEVGLKALQNKTPRTEVMLERAEHVVEALRAELGNLREE